jgi:hypothetical protein
MQAAITSWDLFISTRGLHCMMIAQLVFVETAGRQPIACKQQSGLCITHVQASKGCHKYACLDSVVVEGCLPCLPRCAVLCCPVLHDFISHTQAPSAEEVSIAVDMFQVCFLVAAWFTRSLEQRAV